MQKNFQVHRNAAAKQPRKFPQIAEAVEVVRVHPETWARALKEAGGDRKRIEILSESTVVIWNSAEQKAAVAGRERRVAHNR